MKKILSLILALAMVVTMMSLVGCGDKKAANLKLGLGVHATVEKATSADGDTQGVGQAAVNVAGVLMDADGKIVKCVIDVADNTVNFTADGKAVEAKEFKTKYELGENYGMKAYGGAKKEWFEQIDALVSLIEGKTYEEVLALLGENKKGNEDVINAGCTIMISDVIEAIKAAVKNAKDSGATADDTLKLGIVPTQSGAADATEDKEGANGFDVIINTPTRGRKEETDGFKIRRLAVEHGIPCFTSLDTARAVGKILLDKKKNNSDPSIVDITTI